MKINWLISCKMDSLIRRLKHVADLKLSKSHYNSVEYLVAKVEPIKYLLIVILYEYTHPKRVSYSQEAEYIEYIMRYARNHHTVNSYLLAQINYVISILRKRYPELGLFYTAGIRMIISRSSQFARPITVYADRKILLYKKHQKMSLSVETDQIDSLFTRKDESGNLLFQNYIYI